MKKRISCFSAREMLKTEIFRRVQTGVAEASSERSVPSLGSGIVDEGNDNVINGQEREMGREEREGDGKGPEDQVPMEQTELLVDTTEVEVGPPSQQTPVDTATHFPEWM